MAAEQRIHDFVTYRKSLSEEEYIQWRSLTDAMTHAARMMGLSESKLTATVFQKALAALTEFEVIHHLSFIHLEMSLAGVSDVKSSFDTL